MSKVFLALVDGMRPDALTPAGHPLFEQLKKEASYALDAQTVFPSVSQIRMLSPEGLRLPVTV